MIEALLTAGVITLGLATSYEDIKTGKIRNSITATAITYGILLNYASYFFSWMPDRGIEYTINLAVSALAGYLIWSRKLWSAGDGKLFIAFASLIPLSAYEYWKMPYFQSLILLLNTFAILFTALLAKSINKKCFMDALKDAKELGAGFLTKTIITITGMYWLIGKLPVESMPARYCITAFAVILLQSYLKKSYVYAGAMLLAVRTLEGIPAGFLAQTAWMTMLFIIFKFTGMMMDEIEEKDFPFAVYLTAGALLTLICGFLL
jgi:hypothetical protein